MSTLVATAFSVAGLIFILGLGWKILRYARTPAPLRRDVLTATDPRAVLRLLPAALAQQEPLAA